MEGRRPQFTFASIEAQYRAALEAGYRFVTCADYVRRKAEGDTGRLIVNRIDIDYSVKKAERLRRIFAKLEIPASFFVRLHAPEYNPFSFESYRVLKAIVDDGHELAYHSEIVDQAAIWGEDAADCLKRDLEVLGAMFGVKVVGAASHGGMTGLNNLDFWRDRKPAEFGLLYEGYDKEPEFNLFDTAFYISDSEWTQWKCYDAGKLVEGDRRSFAEHLADGHDLIYLLIHSDTYFDHHFYE